MGVVVTGEHIQRAESWTGKKEQKEGEKDVGSKKGLGHVKNCRECRSECVGTTFICFYSEVCTLQSWLIILLPNPNAQWLAASE